MSLIENRIQTLYKNSELFFSSFIIPFNTNLSQYKFNKLRQTFINIVYDVKYKF